jgi:acyl carrier protein
MLRFWLMKREEILDLVCEAVELPKGSLKGSEELRSLEHWDSLTVMAIIALADERFGVLLSPDEIAACRTVDELAGSMENAARTDA